jgi:hypothetical protein
MAAQKEKKDLLILDAERTEALIAAEGRALEQVTIELDGAIEVVHVERGLGNVSWLGHTRKTGLWAGEIMHDRRLDGAN